MPEQLDINYSAWMTQQEHFQLLLSIGRVTYYFIRMLQVGEDAHQAFLDGDKARLNTLFAERNLLARQASHYDAHVQRMMGDRLN